MRLPPWRQSTLLHVATMNLRIPISSHAAVGTNSSAGFRYAQPSLLDSTLDETGRPCLPSL